MDRSYILGPIVFFGPILIGIILWNIFRFGREARKLEENSVLLDIGEQEYRVTFRVEDTTSGVAGLLAEFVRMVGSEGTIIATVEARTATGWRHVGQQRIPFHPDGHGSSQDPRGPYDRKRRREIAALVVQDALDPPRYSRYS